MTNKHIWGHCVLRLPPASTQCIYLPSLAPGTHYSWKPLSMSEGVSRALISRSYLYSESTEARAERSQHIVIATCIISKNQNKCRCTFLLEQHQHHQHHTHISIFSIDQPLNSAFVCDFDRNVFICCKTWNWCTCALQVIKRLLLHVFLRVEQVQPNWLHHYKGWNPGSAAVTETSAAAQAKRHIYWGRKITHIQEKTMSWRKPLPGTPGTYRPSQVLRA